MSSILKEKLLSLHKEEMVAFLKSNSELFDEALQLALSDEHPFCWRAAFYLQDSMEENDERVRKYVKPILNCIKNKKDGHQRELLKILFKLNLNEKYEGILFDHCLYIWEQLGQEPSVRITALKFVIKIANKHPELKEEIFFLTQDHYLESLSPGVRKSIHKLMKNLKPKAVE